MVKKQLKVRPDRKIIVNKKIEKVLACGLVMNQYTIVDSLSQIKVDSVTSTVKVHIELINDNILKTISFQVTDFLGLRAN